MARRLRRAPDQTLGARLGYRVDRFLGLHPLVQLGAVLGAALVLALGFGVVIHVIDRVGGGGACDPTLNREACSVLGGLWWAITRMVDGGTVSNDSGFGVVHQAFGVGVTLVGLVLVTVLTGAFASSFTARLGAFRSGVLPVFERGHLLVLGWNAHAGVVIRELCRGGERLSIVILSDHDRESVEEMLREQLGGIRHHLRLVVRRGDPTTRAAVRRAAAKRARAVLILPDTELGHCADRAALRSLLALERVLGDAKARPQIVVEVESSSGHEMVKLCEAAGHDVVVVEAHEAHARVVAQAVRQRGAFDVMRRVLALDALSVYLRAPGELGGLSFDEAHDKVEDGVLVGLVHEGAPDLSPEGSTVVEPTDRLLVFSDHPEGEGAEAARREPREKRRPLRSFAPDPASPEAPLRLLVLRYRKGLGAILRFLDGRGPVRATLLASPEHVAEARLALARAGLTRTEIDFVEGDPLERESLEPVLVKGHDAALLLAPDVSASFTPEADADQLISLLQLRQRKGEPGVPSHVVVEVLSPETMLPQHLVSGADFVLSREIVGMLLAREIRFAASGESDLHHQVLAAFGPMVELRAAPRYAGGRENPTFAELAFAARRGGEVALGVAPERGPARLLPPRKERFPAASSRLVVLRSPPRP